jgi:hypothetical protein
MTADKVTTAILADDRQQIEQILVRAFICCKRKNIPPIPEYGGGERVGAYVLTLVLVLLFYVLWH